MSSDPLLDPSLSPIPPEPTTDPFLSLPERNPARLLTLLRSNESLITSAVADFAGGGSLVAAGIAPLVPMLLEQAAGALADTDGQVIDDGLAAIAALCLRARSSQASPVLRGEAEVHTAGPHHNED